MLHTCLNLVYMKIIYSMCIIFMVIHIHPVIVKYLVMEKSNIRSTFQYKLREPKLDELKKLGDHLVDDHMDTFKKAYGNLLSILLTKEYIDLILTFSQFYDLALHYFTFQDFLLAPTLEEFAYILPIPFKDQVTFIGFDGLPVSALIDQVLHLKKEVVESNIRIKGNTRGFPSKFMIGKATKFIDNGRWDALYAILSLLIYGLILFMSIEGFFDKSYVNIFLPVNLVPTLLVDVYFSLHWRNKKKGGVIKCYVPLLYKWLLAQLPRK